MTRSIAALILLLASTATYSQTQDHVPTTLSYAKLMEGKGESWTYFKPGLDLGRYKSIIVDTTSVYQGPEARFGDIAPADRARYAAVITEKLKSEMAKSFPTTGQAGSDTARLRITLLGLEETKGGVATATRVMPIGFAVNAVKSIAGKPGALTGSMLFAVELVDSVSGELLVAAVRRRSPDALDISATISTSDTVKALAEDLAEDLRKKLEKATGRPG